MMARESREGIRYTASVKWHKGHWADCLTPNFSHLPMIWSGRVVESIRRNSLKGLDTRRVELCGRNIKDSLPVSFGFEPIPTGRPLDMTYHGYRRTADGYTLLFETDDENDPRFWTSVDGAYVYKRLVPVSAESACDFLRSRRLIPTRWCLAAFAFPGGWSSWLVSRNGQTLSSILWIRWAQ